MQGNPIPTPQSIGAQPFSAALQAIAELTPSLGGFLVGNGSTWAVQTGVGARSELGGTFVGQSFFTLPNPGIISFPRINANNTVTARLASDYRGDLGLGTIATQAASSVAITGGSITNITDLAVADGGTGASTASGARTNLGLGTASTLNTGTASGDIPVLTTGGLLAEARLPGAGVIRGWAYCEIIAGAPSISASSGVTSVTKVADGIFEINLSSSAPGSGKFACFANAEAPEFWDAATGTAWNNSSKFLVVYARTGNSFIDPVAFSAFAIW